MGNLVRPKRGPHPENPRRPAGRCRSGLTVGRPRRDPGPMDRLGPVPAVTPGPSDDAFGDPSRWRTAFPNAPAAGRAEAVSGSVERGMGSAAPGPARPDRGRRSAGVRPPSVRSGPPASPAPDRAGSGRDGAGCPMVFPPRGSLLARPQGDRPDRRVPDRSGRDAGRHEAVPSRKGSGPEDRHRDGPVGSPQAGDKGGRPAATRPASLRRRPTIGRGPIPSGSG
jgi:hypothetical protein